MEHDTVFLIKNNKKSAQNKPLNVRVFIILLSILLALIALLLVLVLPGFYIQEVRIEGNREVSNEDIMRVIQIDVNDHLISHLGGDVFSVVQFRNGEMEKELIEAYPYIKDVSVTMAYPSSAIIEVKERYKMAYLELPDGYTVIDLEGVVLEMERGTPPHGVPLIQGLSIESASLGTQISFVQQYGFDQNMVILSAIVTADAHYPQSNEGLMSFLRSIRYVDGGISFLCIELPVSNRQIHVKIGSLSNIDEDMTWLRHAVLSGVFEEASGSLLDMTGSHHSLR